MSECKCKPIINIQPKCEPTLDIRPACPVVLDVATTQRGAPGKDATINGVNTLEIVTTDSITSSMDGNTFTISGKTLETAIADEETRAKAAENIVAGAVLDEENRAKGAEQDLASSIESNHTAISDHVADKNNPHVVTKSQVGLGNCDNTSDADKPVSTATQTALNGKVDKTNVASKVYGTDASGNQTTYDADSFGKVDDVKVGGVSVVTNKVANLGTMASETASDYYTSSQVDTALAGKQGTLTASTGIDITSDTISVTDPTIVNNGTGTKALAMGKTSQSTAEGGVAVGYGAQANSTYATAVGYDTRANNTNTTVIGKSAKATQARAIAIGSGAEANAQDAIAIKGINSTANTFQVYTYNMLDMSTGLIPDARISTNIARANAIPTVDQTYDGTSSNPQSGTAVASAIATETTNRENADISLQNQIDAIVSSSYTKGEADNKFVPQTRTVNSKALSSDITLTATDVGALPDNTVIPTVNDATVTIQKNGGTVSTFTLNQSSNETVNLTVPTDTGDLTNGAGFITGITSGDVTTALGYTPANSASLATVATSGSYNDLSNKPTIPTVNDGQLDIQVNGSSIATFTANQSGNTTADITIPSSLPDQTGSEGKFLTTDGTNASWKYVMNYIGTYSATTQYHPGDIVQNYVQGSYHKYLCKKDALGQYPDVTNDYWQDLTGYVSGLYQYSNDYPLISYSVDGWSGNTAKSVRLIVPQTSAAVSNIPTVNTYSGLLKAPGGIDGYSPTSAFGAVAFSNDYTDLDNKPTIPAAQVNSDWNANSGVAEILNKPTLGTMASENASDYTPTSSLATVATSGLYSDLSGTPTIPTVDQTYDGTSTNAQSGTAVAGLLAAIYPVGSLYIGTQATCPLATIMSGTTWSLVSAGKALWTGNGQSGSGTTTNANYANAKANTTIAAGLPDHKHSVTKQYGTTDAASNAGVDGTSHNAGTMSFTCGNASANNAIYGASSTVQPPAYVVNVWRRTA